jgi:hypothetical protein
MKGHSRRFLCCIASSLVGMFRDNPSHVDELTKAKPSCFWIKRLVTHAVGYNECPLGVPTYQWMLVRRLPHCGPGR